MVIGKSNILFAQCLPFFMLRSQHCYPNKCSVPLLFFFSFSVRVVVLFSALLISAQVFFHIAVFCILLFLYVAGDEEKLSPTTAVCFLFC